MTTTHPSRSLRLLAVLALVLGVAATCSPPATAAGDRRQVWEFGRTEQGRDLAVVGRGQDSPDVDVLVVGVIHGGERAGLPVVRRLQRIDVPDGMRIWVTTGINLDGMAAGTRQNSRGVDLNRNFPIGWRRCCRPWHTYYPGPRHSSEAETRAAKALVNRIEPDVTIWYHQHLDMVVRPSRAERVRVARAYAETSGLRLRSLDPLPGTAIAWQNTVHPGGAAIVVELPAGALSQAAIGRHVRAVIAAGRASDS